MASAILALFFGFLVGEVTGMLPNAPDPPSWEAKVPDDMGGFCYWHHEDLETAERQMLSTIARALNVSADLAPEICHVVDRTWITYTLSCTRPRGDLWDFRFTFTLPGGLETHRYCVTRIIENRQRIAYDAGVLRTYPFAILCLFVGCLWGAMEAVSELR